MEINLKAGLITMVVGLFCTACGYICGHVTAMHQHVSTEEQGKMLIDRDGSINRAKYICEAFKDYKRMTDDPLGLNKELS